MERLNRIREEIWAIPSAPGVYKMYDRAGNIIYIGQSGRLRSRVFSYLTGKKTGKIERLVQSIDSISYEVYDTGLEAKLRECELIKKLRPHFNAQYKNDRKYLYLILSIRYPSCPLRPGQERTERSYGPFRSRRLLEELIYALQNLYPLKREKGRFVFTYHVLPEKMSPEEASENLRALERILEEKESADLFTLELEKAMVRASADLKFEQAIFYRELIVRLGRVVSHLRRRRELETATLCLRIPVDGGVKLFRIVSGKLLSIERMNDGESVPEERKYTLLADGAAGSIDLGEKTELDFREILMTELLSTPEEYIEWE